MKQIIALLFTAPFLFWSTSSFSLTHRFDIKFESNKAISEAYIFSPWPAEVVTIDVVWAIASIYEEGTFVETDECADRRTDTGITSVGNITCTAEAEDDSLTPTCAYCNDVVPGGTAPDGMSSTVAYNLLFGFIFVEVSRRDSYVHGVRCRVNLGSPGRR